MFIVATQKGKVLKFVLKLFSIALSQLYMKQSKQF